MSDYIKRERLKLDFSQVPNSALKDPLLSLKSKGLYAYLFSLPEDWKVYKTEILSHFTDGKDSMNAAFKELEDHGYMISKPIRTGGKFKGISLELKITPLRKNRSGLTVDGLTVDGLTVDGKPATTNTDNSNTKKSNIGTRKFVPPSLDQVKEFFKEKGYNEEAAINAFGGYDVADWEDSKGNKIKNWKQKMYHVWFKAENKVQQPTSATKFQPEIVFKK